MKEQDAIDSPYINNHISVNAKNNLSSGEVNELIAEIGVLGNKSDSVLFNKVKEVLNYGYRRESK